MAKDKQHVLDGIFANDPFGLLISKPLSYPPQSEDERLIDSFKKINEFYENHCRLPNVEGDIQEIQLHSRLMGILENPEKIQLLLSFDRFKLLSPAVNIQSDPIVIQSLDDLLNDAMLNDLIELDPEINALFEFKHIPTHREINSRASTDFVARRTPCKDFDAYQAIFNTVQKELKDGTRKLVPFKQDNLDKGVFYVHNGILLFVEDIHFKDAIQVFKSGKRQRKDGRTRIIFENGTESNMLYRSLYKALSCNGYGISATNEQSNAQFITDFKPLDAAEQTTGFLYIVQSQSQNAEIKAIPNLYKIGFSSTDIKQRLKNAAQDPTYLMAEVTLIRAYECYHMNPQKLEKILHTFFGESCLQIDIFDQNGKRHAPREWFIVPLLMIENAISLILTGDIVHYRYDPIYEHITKR